MSTDILLNLLDKSIYLLGDKDLLVSDKGKLFLQAAVDDLRSALQGVQLEDSPVIVFCGKTNVGKSTLLNAVFCGKIAPVYNGDWSARPVEYGYSEEQMIYSADSYPLQKIPFGTEDELSEALLQLSTMKNPDQAVGRDKLIVKLKSPVLEDGLIICDMPGFLATTGEEDTVAEGTHDQDIREYLDAGQKCLRTFIVSDANIPDESVINYIRENFRSAHLSIVINYRSLDNIEERKERLESVWRKELNRALDFHYINAKKALEENPEREDLIRYLQKYSNPEGRREIAAGDLIRVLSEIGVYFRAFLRIHPVDIFKKTSLNVVRDLAENYGDQALINVLDQYWR